jgi:hypothetical protein
MWFWFVFPFWSGMLNISEVLKIVRNLSQKSQPLLFMQSLILLSLGHIHYNCHHYYPKVFFDSLCKTVLQPLSALLVNKTLSKKILLLWNLQFIELRREKMNEISNCWFLKVFLNIYLNIVLSKKEVILSGSISF